MSGNQKLHRVLPMHGSLGAFLHRDQQAAPGHAQPLHCSGNGLREAGRCQLAQPGDFACFLLISTLSCF